MNEKIMNGVYIFILDMEHGDMYANVSRSH